MGRVEERELSNLAVIDDNVVNVTHTEAVDALKGVGARVKFVCLLGKLFHMIFFTVAKNENLSQKQK